MEDLVMDILRILSAPDLEVRKKTLNLALELLTSRTVSESVMFLRKEVGRTHNSVEHDETGKYRQLLVRTLHQCCVKVCFVVQLNGSSLNQILNKNIICYNSTLCSFRM
jgi:coatomer subunit beta